MAWHSKRRQYNHYLHQIPDRFRETTCRLLDTMYQIKLLKILTKITSWLGGVRLRIGRESYHPGWMNPLAPGKFEWNFRYVIFKRNLLIDGWGISYEIALIWMSLDFTDDQSTLVQVMAWCRQATSHYLNQCWPRAMSPYYVIIPQWDNCAICPERYGHSFVVLCFVVVFILSVFTAPFINMD